MTEEWRPPLNHEVHPYTPKPDSRFCICGLWAKHHLHGGISSAVCTCMKCTVSREGAAAAWGLNDRRESR
ncbi:hypothetical protein [Actinomadura geliboluensis]|uniref:hypothetical protein n=1 Tax=Actinomadura geliboluensis TaxID=882440 RepID=UPI0036CF8F74